jgi:hypothetical protein
MKSMREEMEKQIPTSTCKNRCYKTKTMMLVKIMTPSSTFLYIRETE